MDIYDLNLRSYVLFTFDVIRLLGKGEFTASVLELLSSAKSWWFRLSRAVVS